MRTRLTSSFLTPARSRAASRPLHAGLRVAALGLALTAFGCNGGPSETEGSSASESESNSSSSTTGSSQTASVTITTSSSSSTTDTTTTDTTTSGGFACDGVAGFECAEPIDCTEEKCGPLDSHYDDEGCPRPTCATDNDCADGERCYGANWGLCTASVMDCSDAGGVCECGFSGDCGGNYCVPEDAFPSTAAAPANVRANTSCGPDDGPAVKFEFGVSEPDPDTMCKADLSPGWLRIDLWQSAPLSAGLHPISEIGGMVTRDGDLMSSVGWVRIDSWVGDVINGSFGVIIGNELIEGDLVDVPFCNLGETCG